MEALQKIEETSLRLRKEVTSFTVYFFSPKQIIGDIFIRTHLTSIVPFEKQGYNHEALDCMELGLIKRREIYGENSEELAVACKLLGKTCNDLAQQCINESKLDASMEFLKRGESIVQDPQCLQVTYKNMASIYGNKGNLRMAHRYLMLALDLEDDFVEKSNLRKSQILLNVCAVSSQLGKHKAALKHAESAIRLMKNSLLPVLKAKREKSQESSLGFIQEDIQDLLYHDENDKKTHQLTEDEKSKCIETIIIAYYNAGVEQEHMLQFNLSHYCYQNGMKIAVLNYSDDHILVKTLKQSSKSVVRKIVSSNFC